MHLTNSIWFLPLHNAWPANLTSDNCDDCLILELKSPSLPESRLISDPEEIALGFGGGGGGFGGFAGAGSIDDGAMVPAPHRGQTSAVSSDLASVDKIRNIFPETWLWTNSSVGYFYIYVCNLRILCLFVCFVQLMLRASSLRVESRHVVSGAECYPQKRFSGVVIIVSSEDLYPKF